MADEFQTILVTMTDGFNSLHGEIRDLKNEFVAHREVCFTRFSNIEKQQAIKNALNCQEKAGEKERRDWWKYVIRTAIVIMTGGMLGMIYKVFIANIDIFTK